MFIFSIAMTSLVSRKTNSNLIWIKFETHSKSKFSFCSHPSVELKQNKENHFIIKSCESTDCGYYVVYSGNSFPFNGSEAKKNTLKIALKLLNACRAYARALFHSLTQNASPLLVDYNFAIRWTHYSSIEMWHTHIRVELNRAVNTDTA